MSADSSQSIYLPEVAPKNLTSCPVSSTPTVNVPVLVVAPVIVVVPVIAIASGVNTIKSLELPDQPSVPPSPTLNVNLPSSVLSVTSLDCAKIAP